MRIGIDLGGTKTEGIVLDAGGAEVARKRVPTPPNYEGMLECTRALVAWLDEAAGSTATVGVGIPGTEVRATGLIKNANSTWLIGRPLRRDLERVLGRAVRLMNDANCFALSEAADGAGAGHDVVFGVILGTGVGGGIVVRGACLDGPNSIAGEWGHNPLPRPEPKEVPGPACYCGRRGCIETWLSGPAMAREHAALNGEMLATREILVRAATGDAGCRATLLRYQQRLGRALAGVVNVLDPDVIVLGGGMSNLPGLAERVGAEIGRHVFSDRFLTPVRRNVHGDSSGVRGAAWLWPATAGS
jgi:fructokinase